MEGVSSKLHYLPCMLFQVSFQEKFSLFSNTFHFTVLFPPIPFFAEEMNHLSLPFLLFVCVLFHSYTFNNPFLKNEKPNLASHFIFKILNRIRPPKELKTANLETYSYPPQSKQNKTYRPLKPGMDPLIASDQTWQPSVLCCVHQAIMSDIG